MALAPHGAGCGALVGFVDVITAGPGVVQPVDHISLVYVRQNFFRQNLNVQVVSSFQSGFQIGFSAFADVDVGHPITLGFPTMPPDGPIFGFFGTITWWTALTMVQTFAHLLIFLFIGGSQSFLNSALHGSQVFGVVKNVVVHGQEGGGGVA